MAAVYSQYFLLYYIDLHNRKKIGHHVYYKAIAI